MKKTRLFCCVLCFMLFFAALPSHGQDRGEDLAAIYKNYFKMLIDKDFAGAWNGLADQSKRVIAGLIAQEAQQPPDKVLGMLDANENGLRDKYFEAFRKSIRELLDEIYSKGIYTVKSTTGKDAIVNIEVQKDPKDFRMVKEDGKWKVNFFQDLMENK